MDIYTARSIFLDYVARFQTHEASKGAEVAFREFTPVDLKREHTLQVLENARLLLENMDVDEELARLGQLCALFHDVGRFEQYRRHQTFHDPSSLNHGLLGARILAPAPLGEGLLDSLPFAERSLVRASVAMHNRRELPAGLSPLLRFVTNLVRDADKLDIMRVMIAHFSSDSQDPVITLNVTFHPENYTSSVYENVCKGGQGDYRKLRWSNDFKMMLLGWGHNLNFTASRRLLVERSLLEQLLALLPDNPAMQHLGERVHELLEEDLKLSDSPLIPQQQVTAQQGVAVP